MMEKINLENYEAYFLDYVEGSLTKEQLLELGSFLKENPSLRVELEEFEPVVLENQPAVASDLQSALIREETTGLLLADYLMISQVEGTINSKEKAQLAEIVKRSPQKLEELAAYHKTILKQDETIVFAEKSALMQKENKAIVWWVYTSSIAAAILALFLFNINLDTKEYSPAEFAWKEAPTNYEGSIQYRFVAQQEKVIVPVKKGAFLPSKPLDRTFASQQESEMNSSSGDKTYDKETPSIPLIENNEMAQVEEAPDPQKEHALNEKSITDNPVVEEGLLALNDSSEPTEDRFIPIKEFAKDKIKDNVLKGKTFSETVLDELAEVSNEKITFERKKDSKGSNQNFALNIGKFSISRNK